MGRVRRLTTRERERLCLLALACAVACSTSSRDRAPFLPDTAEATMWKLAAKRYVEVQLPPRDRGPATFRPTRNGWAVYEQWLEVSS